MAICRFPIRPASASLSTKTRYARGWTRNSRCCEALTLLKVGRRGQSVINHFGSRSAGLHHQKDCIKKNDQEREMSEHNNMPVQDVTPALPTPDELEKLILKLRWIGLENEAADLRALL